MAAWIVGYCLVTVQQSDAVIGLCCAFSATLYVARDGHQKNVRRIILRISYNRASSDILSLKLRSGTVENGVLPYPRASTAFLTSTLYSK